MPYTHFSLPIDDGGRLFQAFTTFVPDAQPDQAFTLEECKTVIDLADGLDVVEPLVGTEGVTDLAVRDVERRLLPVSDDSMAIFQRVVDVVQGANAVWWGFAITTLTEMEVLRYTPGQHYVAHADHGPGMSTRKLSVSIQLSDPDEYDGGDLELMFQAEPVKAPRERGSIIVFPSWTLHRVTPVTRGERRAMTAWIQGPAFR